MEGCEDLLPVFVNSKDESFRFYIHHFTEKERITKLIEWCRGFVEEEPGGEYTVELASPGFKAGTNEVFSIEYVLACCAKRKILNIKDFRLNITSAYDDDFNPMDVLQGHISWSEAAEKYRNRFRLNPPKTYLGYDGVRKESTHRRKESECSNKEHDDKVHKRVEEKKNQNESGTSCDDNSEDEARNGNKEIFERKIKYYSADEDAALMNFIIKRERWRSSGGTKIWKLMERKQVVPGRTWQSMKERYRKVLVNKVEEYLQKSEEVKKSGMKGADHLTRRKVKQKAYDRSGAASHNLNQDDDDFDVKNGRKKHSVPLQPVCTCCFKSSISTSPRCSNSNRFTSPENSKKVMSSHRKHTKANSSVTKAASPKEGKKGGFRKGNKRKLYYQRNSLEMNSSSDDDTTWARMKHHKLQEKRRKEKDECNNNLDFARVLHDNSVQPNQRDKEQSEGTRNFQKNGAVNQGALRGSTENGINNEQTKNVTNKDWKLQSCSVLCDNLQIENLTDFDKRHSTQQVNSEHNNIRETGTGVQFLQCNGNEIDNGNKRDNITQSNPPPKESNTNEKHQTKNTDTFVKRRTQHADLESASSDTDIESVEIGRKNQNGGKSNEVQNNVEHNRKEIENSDSGIRTTTNINTGIELSKGNGNVILDGNKTRFITENCPPAKDSNTNENKSQTLLITDTVVKQRIEQGNLESASSDTDMESVGIDEINSNDNIYNEVFNNIEHYWKGLANSESEIHIRSTSNIDTRFELTQCNGNLNASVNNSDGITQSNLPVQESNTNEIALQTLHSDTFVKQRIEHPNLESASSDADMESVDFGADMESVKTGGNNDSTDNEVFNNIEYYGKGLANSESEIRIRSTTNIDTRFELTQCDGNLNANVNNSDSITQSNLPAKESNTSEIALQTLHSDTFVKQRIEHPNLESASSDADMESVDFGADMESVKTGGNNDSTDNEVFNNIEYYGKGLANSESEIRIRSTTNIDTRFELTQCDGNLNANVNNSDSITQSNLPAKESNTSDIILQTLHSDTIVKQRIEHTNLENASSDADMESVEIGADIESVEFGADMESVETGGNNDITDNEVFNNIEHYRKGLANSESEIRIRSTTNIDTRFELTQCDGNLNASVNNSGSITQSNLPVKESNTNEIVLQTLHSDTIVKQRIEHTNLENASSDADMESVEIGADMESVEFGADTESVETGGNNDITDNEVFNNIEHYRKGLANSESEIRIRSTTNIDTRFELTQCDGNLNASVNNSGSITQSNLPVKESNTNEIVLQTLHSDTIVKQRIEHTNLENASSDADMESVEIGADMESVEFGADMESVETGGNNDITDNEVFNNIEHYRKGLANSESEIRIRSTTNIDTRFELTQCDGNLNASVNNSDSITQSNLPVKESNTNEIVLQTLHSDTIVKQRIEHTNLENASSDADMESVEIGADMESVEFGADTESVETGGNNDITDNEVFNNIEHYRKGLANSESEIRIRSTTNIDTRFELTQCDGNLNASVNNSDSITQSNLPVKESNTNEIVLQTLHSDTIVKQIIEHTNLESASSDADMESVETGGNNDSIDNEVSNNIEHYRKGLANSESEMHIRSTNNIDTSFELTQCNGNLIANVNNLPAKESNTNENQLQTLHSDTIFKQRIEQVNLESANSVADRESVEIGESSRNDDTDNDVFNNIERNRKAIENSDLEIGIKTRTSKGTKFQLTQCDGNLIAPTKGRYTNDNKHKTLNIDTIVKQRIQEVNLDSANSDTDIESMEIEGNNRNGSKANDVLNNIECNRKGLENSDIEIGIRTTTNENKLKTQNSKTVGKRRIGLNNLENSTSDTDMESVEIRGNNTIGGNGNEVLDVIGHDRKGLENADFDKTIRTITIMDTLDDLRDTNRKEGNRTQNIIHQNDRKIGNCDLEVHSSFEVEMHTIEDIKSSTNIEKDSNIQNSFEYCETNTDISFTEQDSCTAKEINIVEGIESCTNKEMHNKNIIKHCDRILNSQDLEKDISTDTEMNMMENIGSNIELYVEQNGIENCDRRIGSYALEQNAATDAQLDKLEDIGSSSNREVVNKVQNIIKYHDRRIRNHGLEKGINTESELVMHEIGKNISMEKAITFQKNFENCDNKNNFEFEKDIETGLCSAAENINKLSLYSKGKSTSLIDNTIKSNLRNENYATSILLEKADIFDKKNITTSMSSSSFCDIDEICMGKNLDGTDNEKSSAIENSLQLQSELFISRNQLKNEREINPDLKCQKSCMLHNISISVGKTVALNHEDNTKDKSIVNKDEVGDSNNKTKYLNVLLSEFCKSYENESPKLKCCLENLHDEVNLFSDDEIEILDFPEESNSSDIIDKNCVEDNDCSLKEIETFTSDHSNKNTNKTSLSQLSVIETNSKKVNVVQPLCKSFVFDSLTSNGKENSMLSSQHSITSVLKAAGKSGSEVDHDQCSNFLSLPSNKIYVSKSLKQNEIPVDVKRSSNGQPQTLESIEQRQKILKSVEQPSNNKFSACESINEEHEIPHNVQKQSENEINPCTFLRKEQEFLKDIQQPSGEEEQGQEILKHVQKTINGLSGYKSVHIVSKHVQEPSNEGVVIGKSIKQGQISNYVQKLPNDMSINQGREIPKDIHNGCRSYPAGHVQLSNPTNNVNVKSQKGTDHFTDFVSNYFLKEGYCYKKGKKYNILSPIPEAMVISDCVNGAENIISLSKKKVEKERSYNFYVSSGHTKFREIRPKLPSGAVTSEDLLLLKKSNICTDNNLSLTVLSPHTGIQSNNLLLCPPQNISFSQSSSSCEFPEGNKKQMRETVKRTCPSPYKKHHKKLKHTSVLRKIDVEPLRKAVISPLIFLSINNFQPSYSEKHSSDNESLEKYSSSDSGPNIKKCINNEEILISETSEGMGSQINDHNYSCSTISKSSTSVNSLHSLDYHKHSSYCESFETFRSSDTEVKQNNEECSICETGEGMEPQMNDHYSCSVTKHSSASVDSFQSSNDYRKQSVCESLGTFGSSEVGKEKQLENDKEGLICMLNAGLESHVYDHNYSQQLLS